MRPWKRLIPAGLLGGALVLFSASAAGAQTDVAKREESERAFARIAEVLPSATPRARPTIDTSIACWSRAVPTIAVRRPCVAPPAIRPSIPPMAGCPARPTGTWPRAVWAGKD